MSKSINEINKILAEKEIDPQLRADLEKKLEILKKKKTVKK